jgi:hypothetical protein
MTDECGAVDGMRIEEETEILGDNLTKFHFVHNGPHTTRPGIESGPPPEL